MQAGCPAREGECHPGGAAILCRCEVLRMSRKIAAIGLAVAVTTWMAGVSKASSQTAPVPEAPLAEARAVAKELTTELRKLLSEELAKGGFAGAVRVCSEQAQTVSGTFNASTGASARRVSLRYRNPNDRPDPYEAALLRRWAALPKGERAPEEHSQVVTDPKGQQHLRFLQPIYVQAMCLTCHGDPKAIPVEVKHVLGERYPKDLATGYQTGDFRGAVSVRIPLAGK